MKEASEMSSEELLQPIINHYLTTVWFHLHPETNVGPRASRELRTWAHVGDALLTGQVSKALDFITQRVKALQMATEQSSWEHARWLELLPPTDSSARTRVDLELTQREERKEQWMHRDQGNHGNRSRSGGQSGWSQDQWKSGNRGWQKSTWQG